MEKLPQDPNTPGPTSIVFKKCGGNVFDEDVKEVVITNSPLVQSLIFYEQSKRVWGPKLCGLLEIGRIEEFVSRHTLNQKESFTSELNQLPRCPNCSENK